MSYTFSVDGQYLVKTKAVEVVVSFDLYLYYSGVYGHVVAVSYACLSQL